MARRLLLLPRRFSQLGWMWVQSGTHVERMYDDGPFAGGVVRDMHKGTKYDDIDQTTTGPEVLFQ